MKSEQNAEGNAEGEFCLGNIRNDKPHLKTRTVVIHDNTGLAKKFSFGFPYNIVRKNLNEFWPTQYLY